MIDINILFWVLKEFSLQERLLFVIDMIFDEEKCWVVVGLVLVKVVVFLCDIIQKVMVLYYVYFNIYCKFLFLFCELSILMFNQVSKDIILKCLKFENIKGNS